MKEKNLLSQTLGSEMLVWKRLKPYLKHPPPLSRSFPVTPQPYRRPHYTLSTTIPDWHIYTIQLKIICLLKANI